MLRERGALTDFCTSPSERVISQPGAVKLASRQGYRVCVETRFSWLEIKRDHDPLQNSGVSIFAERRSGSLLN